MDNGKRQEVIIRLAGRIDSGNAAETQERIEAEWKAHEGAVPVFDASDLVYISSAGLRILMRIRKKAGEALLVREVSPEVYDIFETTGFTELLNVRKRLRRISVDGCEKIGKGFYGTVYRIDEDTIVKVYDSPDSLAMIESERSKAKMAFLRGIPTAISYDIVRVGESYGSVFELLRAKTFNDLLIEKPGDAEQIIRQYASFLKEVHEIKMEAGALPTASGIFLNYLDKIEELLDDGLAEGIRSLFEALPEDLHVVHGDFQMKNVMLVEDEPMLIDMDTLCVGQPVFDLAGLFVTYRAFGEDEPENSMNFLGIPSEMCDLIWRRLLEHYFGTDDEAVLSAVSDQIRIAGYVRFLFILAVSDLRNGELGATRIRHANRHLKNLLPKVDSLLFSAP